MFECETGDWHINLITAHGVRERMSQTNYREQTPGWGGVFSSGGWQTVTFKATLRLLRFYSKVNSSYSAPWPTTWPRNTLTSDVCTFGGKQTAECLFSEKKTSEKFWIWMSTLDWKYVSSVKHVTHQYTPCLLVVTFNNICSHQHFAWDLFTSFISTRPKTDITWQINSTVVDWLICSC